VQILEPRDPHAEVGAGLRKVDEPQEQRPEEIHDLPRLVRPVDPLVDRRRHDVAHQREVPRRTHVDLLERLRRDARGEARLLEEHQHAIGLREARVVGVEVVPHALELPVGREPGRHDLLDRLAHALHALEEERDVEVFLGAIVEVDRPDGDLGLSCDVLDRRAREPLLGEDADGRRLEGLSPGAALADLPVRSPHSSRRIRARAGGR